MGREKRGRWLAVAAMARGRVLELADDVRGQCGKRMMGGAVGRVRRRRRGDAQMKDGGRPAGDSAGEQTGPRGFAKAAGTWLNGREMGIRRSACELGVSNG